MGKHIGELLSRMPEYEPLHDRLREGARIVFALRKKGEAPIAISLSENSKNVLDAMLVARAHGVPGIGVAGDSGGTAALQRADQGTKRLHISYPGRALASPMRYAGYRSRFFASPGKSKGTAVEPFCLSVDTRERGSMGARKGKVAVIDGESLFFLPAHREARIG